RSEYARVVAVAARVLGSRDQAEDVAQEVFLSFGRSAVPGEEAADDGPSLVPDVADLVITRNERSAVRAALSRLPHRQAAALVLRHSGLSYAEVAAALDLSPGSVGTTVRRAESVLLKELNRHASSE
ncbi:MAG: polymerase sigma factor, sigma-70 family, partial [Actinotalea sp.]|nr:polymerase sigma factor, sigma-70 family [Actinotalea sp.]